MSCKFQEDPNYKPELPKEIVETGSKDDGDEKFNKLVSSTPKKPKEVSF